MSAKDRWIEHEPEAEDCRHCQGTGRDDDELDGDCVNCWGRGWVEHYISECSWCGEFNNCQCDDNEIDNEVSGSAAKEE